MPNVRLGPDDTESLVRFLEAQNAARTQLSSTAKTGGEEKHVEKPASAN
jgi:hypothetical protein